MEYRFKHLVDDESRALLWKYLIARDQQAKGNHRKKLVHIPKLVAFYFFSFLMKDQFITTYQLIYKATKTMFKYPDV